MFLKQRPTPTGRWSWLAPLSLMDAFLLLFKSTHTGKPIYGCLFTIISVISYSLCHWWMPVYYYLSQLIRGSLFMDAYLLLFKSTSQLILPLSLMDAYLILFKSTLLLFKSTHTPFVTDGCLSTLWYRSTPTGRWSWLAASSSVNSGTPMSI